MANKIANGSRSGPEKAWFQKVLETIKDDQLLQYLDQARHADEHGIEGVVEGVKSNPTGFGIAISQNRIHFGTSYTIKGIRLKTVVNRGVSYDPPKEHLGKLFASSSTLVRADLAISYYAQVIKEASAFVRR